MPTAPSAAFTAEHFFADDEAFEAVLVALQTGCPVAVDRVHVVDPEIEWFQDMAVGIDGVVVACHVADLPLFIDIFLRHRMPEEMK
jgi:hypothetical protein